MKIRLNLQIGRLNCVVWIGLLQLSSVRLFIIRISWDFWIEFVSWWQLTVCFNINAVLHAVHSPHIFKLWFHSFVNCLGFAIVIARQQFSNWCIWRCWKLFASVSSVMLAPRAVWWMPVACSCFPLATATARATASAVNISFYKALSLPTLAYRKFVSEKEIFYAWWTQNSADCC